MNFYNCAKNEDDHIIHDLPIARAYTVITPPNEKPFIGLFHQMTYSKFPNENESLALPFQLMEHSVKADLTPKCYRNVEGNDGAQSFMID